MAASVLLLPPVLLVLAGAVVWLPRLPPRLAGRVPALGAWAAAGALLAMWIQSSALRELEVLRLGDGARLGFRLDAVAYAFSLLSVVTLGLVLTLRPSRRADACFTAWAAAAAVLGIEASNLALALVAWSTAGLFLRLSPRHETSRAALRFWVSIGAANTVLVAALALLQSAADTSDYTAVPAGALTWPAFVLLAGAALWIASATPFPGWLHGLWDEAGPVSASLFAAVLVPVGFYLLLRSYQVGDGKWPGEALNYLVLATGVLTALTAAYRAQAAATLAEFVLEVVPFTGGFAVLAAAAGSPAGVAAAVTVLAGLVVVIPLLPALAHGRTQAVTLGIVLLAGLPPTLLFGSRLLALQTVLEAGPGAAFGALAAAGAYLLLLAASARALRLPAGRQTEVRDVRAAVGGELLVALAGGVALGFLVGTLGLPVASDLVAAAGQPSITAQFVVVTNSGAFAPLPLLVPLAVVAVALAVLNRGRFRLPRPPATATPPFWTLPFDPDRWRGRLRLRRGRPDQQLRVPEAMALMPLGLGALLAGFIFFVVFQWST